MKLKTKLIHSFDIDSNLMDDLDFNINIPSKSIKVKRKIVEVSKKKNLKFDTSTQLF
jgi:hypothetical protein